ncbi:hypothetical protein [Streptomyces sp. NPDC048659]|uniref:hypothetical protein n=1 Tax=Streptomyces sp. NPDC048659 TaxID=3155489 RepID=UPI0034126D50
MSSTGASAGAIHRLVVFGDVVGSGRLGMDEKRLTRAAMYEAFGEAYASVGIEPGTVHQEDRGDGILAALRPDVPPTLMVGRWIDTLYESLREHNKGRRAPLRMRVGMNAGLVLDDGRGLVGRAVDLACRLCDSARAKQIMTDAPDVDLLIVVSDWLYRNVVVEGGRYVEPAHYRRAPVVAKETDEDAWFHVPRRPSPPLGPEGAEWPGGPEGPDVPVAHVGSAGSAGSGRSGGPGDPEGDTQTGGGPSRGDGSPPRKPRVGGGDRTFTAGRDMQIVEAGTIHGGVTGFGGKGKGDRA